MVSSDKIRWVSYTDEQLTVSLTFFQGKLSLELLDDIY